MNHQLSHEPSLAFGSSMMSSAFSDAAKNVWADATYDYLRWYPFDPGHIEHWYTHFNSMFSYVSC
jgi:hypothetical protein